MSCHLIHYAQIMCIELNITHFFSVNRLKACKSTLFTKSIIVIFKFNLFNKSTLKNNYKMKNINNFYEIFVRILQYFVLCCVNDKMMFLFFTNNAVYFIIHSNIFFWKLCNNCSWLIVENAETTFVFNKITILSFF